MPPGVVIEPDERVDAAAVAAALGKGPFAVRSSAPHEDGARASWGRAVRYPAVGRSGWARAGGR